MKKILTVLLVMLLLMGGMMMVVSRLTDADDIGSETKSASNTQSKSYTSHDSIHINGNSNFTSANGVTSGSGTAGGPYIIEKWDIYASAHSENAIWIEHTDAYFIIRNCILHGRMSEYTYGIYFDHVQNGTIENCEIYNNYFGIHFYFFSKNNFITSNQIHNNEYGIMLRFSSNNNVIYHNNLINNAYNAYDECSNFWDNGYPGGGNYWSDYTGTDNDGDGIGDTPYSIGGGANVDNYPLMKAVSTTVNQAPTVTISSPSNGETVSGTITVSGSASDSDDSIISVQIRIDSGSWTTVSGTTSWSYSWDTTKVSDGSHTISIRSFDGTDYSSIDSISVNVKNEEESQPTPEKKEEKGFIPGFETAAFLTALLGVCIILLRKRRR